MPILGDSIRGLLPSLSVPSTFLIPPPVRWITGALRTSPSRSFNIAALLLPSDVYLKQLHQRTTNSHLGRIANSIDAYAADIRNFRRKANLPLQELAQFKSTADEEFATVYNERPPRARLIDISADRIVLDTDVAHKHRSLDCDDWLAGWETKLSSIEDDPTQTYAFADGSALPNKQSRSTARLCAQCGRTQSAGTVILTGRCSPFNVEAFAINLAINALTNLNDASDIHVFADNNPASCFKPGQPQILATLSSTGAGATSASNSTN
ncbi:unnamed protein product [Peniophora sp. CBMAI 1063]|nr:unnamed protein product [Peniophora sp. CBMAI 1063]